MIVYVIFGVIVFNAFTEYSGLGGEPEKRELVPESLIYSKFIESVNAGEIEEVGIDGKVIVGKYKNGSLLTTYMPIADNGLMGDLLNNKVGVMGDPPVKESVLLDIFISWFPMLLLIGVWVFFMKRMSGGKGNSIFSAGSNKARLVGKGEHRVTFADVAGCDEAKQDLSELVEFLKNPSKFSKIGGKIPRGVLMSGAPGTGKTLLAKAIAGEAKVPFFTIAGSDFVEMFVGVGASRVRNLFKDAKKNAPCIIFIDEIDAVGRNRGAAGGGGGNDESEQTLNQMLVEMDGFSEKEGVIVVAATNRPDVLDSALMRPGRFDRQVTVGLPDIKGREAILKVHMRKIVSDDTVDLSMIARGTPGFSGADLENLANEAALLAARVGKDAIGMVDVESAKDKIMMGAERRSLTMSDQEKKLTAYHEAGHAIVGLLVPEHDPVYKVTIIPRGRALGVTMFLPEEDRVSYSRDRLESQISSLFGGRIAEEMIFGRGKVTTGASNDIERATAIARNMVTRWGFSDVLGPLAYNEESEGFMGQPGQNNSPHSAEIAKRIDDEIREIVDKNYSRAKGILEKNIDKLTLMAEELIELETIGKDDILRVMGGSSLNTK